MTRSTSQPDHWDLRGDRRIALDRAQLMAVLNVTPDSFSDGGRWVSDEAAVHRAMEVIERGAVIIDVGGESSRPGATRVAVAEQIRRTAGVIEQIRARSDVVISIDTTQSAVAGAALDAGADIINDIAAGEEDHAMFALAAARGCGLILMHRPRPSTDESYSDQYRRLPTYGDVTAEVRAYLAERARRAESAGVARSCIVLDPGLGFGKSVPQNFQLIRETARLQELGYPLLSAASRKSFIGAPSGIETPEQRVAGSIAVSVAHWMAGVRLFRVHDVEQHRQALAVAAAISLVV